MEQVREVSSSAPALSGNCSWRISTCSLMSSVCPAIVQCLVFILADIVTGNSSLSGIFVKQYLFNLLKIYQIICVLT